MDYKSSKEYIKFKYPNMDILDIDFIFSSVENLYMNRTSPFDLSKKFDETNLRAINWVTRAVTNLIELGFVDFKSYSENGLSVALGDSMVGELVTFAGVDKS